MQDSTYAYRTTIEVPYDEAVKRVVEALQEEGFSVLTEIDMKAKLKEKLSVDFRSYVVLGACNPKLAHRALEAEIEVGTLLPCNVVVYEDDAGRSVVAAMSPRAAMSLVENDDLAKVAAEADTKIARMLGAIEAREGTVS